MVFSIQEPNAQCSYGLCGNFTEECKDKESQTKGGGVPINTKPEVEKLANMGNGKEYVLPQYYFITSYTI